MINHVLLFCVSDSLAGYVADRGADGTRKADLVQPDIEDPPSDLIPD